MNFHWTDGPELSILLVRENGMDYAAEVRTDDDVGGFYWEIHRNNRWERSGKNDYRETAKREAEIALTALIEGDAGGRGDHDAIHRCDRCGTSSSSPVCVRPGCNLEGVEEQLAAVTAERDRLVRAVNRLENMLDGGIRYGNENNVMDRLRWKAQNVNTTIALTRQNDELRASLKSVTAERDAVREELSALNQRIADAKKVMNQDYGQDVRWYALVPLDEELNLHTGKGL